MSEYNKTNYETIKPFEPTNEIEQGYLDDILSIFENEIKVTGIKEYQSPYSTSKSKTVLIEYVSHPDFNWREDAVFNLLHDKDILDTSIDYTPITPDKSGTINDYLKRLQEESRFDREIEAFVRGELPDNHVFFLGLPGEILKKCGFPEKNVITLTSSRLKQKSTQENHPFSPLNIKGLDKALQTPIAVFDYARSGNNDMQNVIVDITQDEKHFLAGISFNKKMSGYEVSNIRGLFPKDDYQWLHWVEQGKMIYGNKEKIQALSTQRRIDLAEVSSQDARISSDIHCLDSIDTILGKFGSVNDIFTQEFSFYAQQKEFYSIYRKIHASFAWDAVYEDDARFYAEKIFKAIHEQDTDTLKQYVSFEDVYEISDVVREILSEKSGFSTIQSQEQLNKAVSFVTQKKENFMGINEQAQNQNVKNKEEIWTWIHYSDGSGHVRSPNGKKYFVYDWDTKEYRVTPASRWEIYIDVYDPSDKNKTFDDFKKFEEQEIKIKIAKNPNVLFESRHIREEELLEKNIEEQPIHEHERIKIPKQTIQGEKNMEQTEKQTPYYQQQIEKLHEAVKTGTAPFLPNEKNSKAVNNVIILTPRPVVRSAASGKVFKGLNQLVAQVELDKMSRKDASVITYEQAQKLGSAIKKGEKSFTLTSYNKDAPAGTRLTVYHVFPTSAVASHSANLNEKLAHIKKLSERNKTSIVIECTDSKPETFLGAYLAASSCNGKVKTNKQTVESFRNELTAYLEKNIQSQNHSKVFELGRNASNECKIFLRNEYKNQQQLSQARAKTQQYTMKKNNDFELSR